MKMKMIVLLLLISQHASGVEVYEGVKSVLLPCQVPADVSRSSTSAVWDCEEFRNPTVHLRKKSGDDLSDQNDRYLGRTSMFGDALQTGDLSLTLRNPTVLDSGTYTCIALKAGEPQSQTKIQLKVTEPPVWPKVLAAVLVTLIILAAAFGLFVCRAYKRMKNRQALQTEVVEVPQGEESVLLPFKTKAVLPQKVTVEWTLTQPKPVKVHMYESGNNQPDKQDHDYRGRTEMKEDPLRTKDLSLTLKHLHFTDSGEYTCTVYNKDGHMLLQKVVMLRVTALQPEVVEVLQGEESFLLPFKTKTVLPQDVTVKWRHKYIEVHVYESGNSQPDKQDHDYRGRTEMKEDPLRSKDLSLTLKDLRLTDSGVYTCTVYNKDGHMLLQKSVTLSVTALQSEKVEGRVSEYVLLPFKTESDLPQDVTVEWTHNYMKVHVNESGKDQPDKQDPHYTDYTEMNKNPLRNKDLSLTLKHLRLTDSGVYTCTVYKKDGHMLLQKSVILTVTDSQTEWEEVPQVEESVQLYFKTTDDLPQDVTVEWRHKHMKVHVYESGKNQPDKQNQGYRGRTEMKEDPLRNKDLSLTLKHLRLTDSGVYTCTVYNKDGLMPIQKSVRLSVTVPEPKWVEKPQGEESVVLLFKTTADLPQDVTVEWRCSDSNNMMVHMYESGKHQLGKQDQGYRGRTEMKEDPLRTGDFSLTLKHLRLTDSGEYTCTVYNKDGHMLLQKAVILTVTVPEPEVVEVPQGKESVLLPFTTTPGLPHDNRVEWTHSDFHNMLVHMYESGKHHLGKHDQGYRGRTEMKEDPLRTGDLSLTLKDLHLSDRGVYICTVYNKYRDKLLQKSVTLIVRGPQPEVVEVPQGGESVLLPFKTTADLPENVTVQWTLTEPKHMMVHVYESGKHQPGKQDQDYRGRTEMDEDPLRTKDLSLTLKDLHLADSGVYTCTVYNKDGHMLLRKVVTLSVKDFQLEKVEVTEGEESVLLPFKVKLAYRLNVTVEWRRSDNMKVHVYERGKHQPGKQDQDYRGRTEMNEHPLRTGDFSLTLKHLRFSDSGVYTCTVYNKDGHMMLQKVVMLSVRATLTGTMEDMLPCLRRRRTAPKPEVKVEPRNRNHEDVPLMEVHSA